MENLSRRICQLSDKKLSADLMKVLSDVYNRFRSCLLTTGGLAISATTTLVKAGTLCKYIAQGVLRSITADTDLPALVGTVINATFNVFVFTADKDGTTYTQMGVAGTTLAGVKWPAIPATRAILGFVIINPTGTGNFVGGTTPLGDGTVVPNAVYVNTVGPIDPTAAVI